MRTAAAALLRGGGAAARRPAGTGGGGGVWRGLGTSGRAASEDQGGGAPGRADDPEGAAADPKEMHERTLGSPENAGQRQAKPEEELYGRPDRDPMPSPLPGLTQESAADAGMTPRPEPIEAPGAYPIGNDPSVSSGRMGPASEGAAPPPQDESHGPKAAGQDAINRGDFKPKGEAKEGPGAV